MIELPPIPAGITTLLAFFAPYAVSALNGVLPFVTKSWQRKLVAVVVAIVLAIVVLAFFYVYTGEPLPDWPVLFLLSIVVMQASYALVTKDAGAAELERKTAPTQR